MKVNYLAGGYGYGHAKQALLELVLSKFSIQREKYNHLMNNRVEIDAALEQGAQKAREVAKEVLNRVRMKLGYE
jgi:tryptophanyl-tRNA synthetase